ncbi:hypothetical protein H8B06_20330 [Sphingobacterium sp. DN00404]|uniref:Uncharacterized protein n=1 Tax=Sphingobacterium micropteri TaxID=2763501 RepID=A0ABR7YVC7_9SPHI|nr:hypothetical protein [Sphingobacterium micropteri]MBD1435178.1 hypothetical protein [Sphingobacterium micropteri]
MKFNDFTFPHPVLGIGDAIRGITGFVNNPQITVLEDRYKILIECNLTNDDLNKILQEGNAEFLCEATCSNTVYRENTISDNARIEFEVPKKQVKGKVEFICLLVAKKNLLNYSNADAHPDYSGFTFDLDKGDILVFFGEFNFDADIKYEKLKAVSSFMEVVGRDDIEYTNIDLKKSKIEVQLPTNEYNIYRGDIIAQEMKFAPIFHASFVLNALLTALYNFEDNKDYLWAKALKYRLDNEDQFKNINIQDKDNIPEIAQRLLGNPFGRLLNGLNVIVESTENEE